MSLCVTYFISMGERRREVHSRFSWGNRKEGEHRQFRCRWEDIIKADLKEIELMGLDWIHLPQDKETPLRLVAMQ